MLPHSDRQATLWWAKGARPFRVAPETRWLRYGPCRGNQPLLRAAPVQRVS